MHLYFNLYLFIKSEGKRSVVGGSPVTGFCRALVSLAIASYTSHFTPLLVCLAKMGDRHDFYNTVTLHVTMGPSYLQLASLIWGARIFEKGSTLFVVECTRYSILQVDTHKDRLQQSRAPTE